MGRNRRSTEDFKGTETTVCGTGGATCHHPCVHTRLTLVWGYSQICRLCASTRPLQGRPFPASARVTKTCPCRSINSHKRPIWWLCR